MIDGLVTCSWDHDLVSQSANWTLLSIDQPGRLSTSAACHLHTPLNFRRSSTTFPTHYLGHPPTHQSSSSSSSSNNSELCLVAYVNFKKKRTGFKTGLSENHSLSLKKPKWIFNPFINIHNHDDAEGLGPSIFF